MKQFFTAILLLVISVTFGQNPQYYRVKENNELVVLSPADNGNIIMYQVSGLFESAKRVVYIDSANNFKVDIPKWLNLRETNNLNYAGGTLPAIKEIENAIFITSVKKEKYKSFDAFKEFIIQDSTYKIGASPKWSNNITFLLIKKDTLNNISHLSYKASLLKQGKIFVCNYVMVETETAYLWIQFVATEDTYNENISKFEEFMSKFTIKL